LKYLLQTILYGLCILLFTACSMTRSLKEGQLLHAKTNFRFANREKVNKPGSLKPILATIAKPAPASGLEKLQVSIYQSVTKKGKEKGVGAWFQRKFGRPPAIYNDRLAEQSRLVMEKYLQDIGYFGASIRMDTVKKDKKVGAVFHPRNLPACRHFTAHSPFGFAGARIPAQKEPALYGVPPQ
jgi:hypothetical protein